MYLIEGNIGAGKSTFATILQQSFSDAQVVTEPLHKWHTHQMQNSLLGHFISAPRRWAFTMETYAMINRVQDHTHYQAYDMPVIMERSVYSGHYCFACNGFRQGFFTLKEWEIYMQYFYYLIPRYCKPPHGFIFLDVSPEVAYERINRRNRDQEEGIPLSYLQQLDEMHRLFLIEKERVLPELEDIPVLRLSVDTEFASNLAQQEYMIDAVKAFMKHHG